MVSYHSTTREVGALIMGKAIIIHHKFRSLILEVHVGFIGSSFGLGFLWINDKQSNLFDFRLTWFFIKIISRDENASIKE